MRSILLVDVDGTLCATVTRPEAFKTRWQPHWQRIIATTDLPPLPEALAALATRPALPIVVVSCRPHALLGVTRSWVDRHFPALRGVRLVLAPPGDTLTDHERRFEQITEARGDCRVILVDDKPVDWMLRPGDAQILAPRGWKMLGRALELGH